MLLRQLPSELSAKAGKMTLRLFHTTRQHGMVQTRKRYQNGWAAQAAGCWISLGFILLLIISTLG